MSYDASSTIDADTREARLNDTARQVAAFASGAQFVSTDYMTPDTRFSPYTASLPGGGPGSSGRVFF